MSYNQWYRADTEACVKHLLKNLHDYDKKRTDILDLALSISRAADKKTGKFSTARLLNKYKLNTPEGTALLSVAEAFIRIPDKKTRKLFIHDKLNNKNWGDSDFPVLSSVLNLGGSFGSGMMSSFVLPAIDKSINVFGKQFVLGQTVQEALKNKTGLISCDMLGEAALTADDSDKYLKLYQDAIDSLEPTNTRMHKNDSISVKLSALDPKFDSQYADYVVPRLIEKLESLALLALSNGLTLTIDAEEADKLEITLQVLEGVMEKGLLNVGIAVQAYQKRAYAVIEHLIDLTEKYETNLPVRLVKGAYWDSEIKWAQENGLDYPVFTMKELSDVSYIACAEKMLSCSRIYGQFATHNIHTIATIMKLAGDREYEMQRLHGMGEEVFDVLEQKYDVRCRVYAPVGNYKELLPYLVRRMLENGANTSFISSFVNGEFALRDPVERVRMMDVFEHEAIPNAKNLYKNRVNSSGIDLSDSEVVIEITKHVEEYTLPENPSDGTPDLMISTKEQGIWSEVDLEQRATMLEKVADLMEESTYDLIALCVKEAYKTIPDSVGEIREAIDFLRYYAQQAREQLAPITMPGVTGEENTLSYEPRGLWLAISPWNFPVAIFTGQIAAALVCGNAVVAKPAEQTQRIAKYVADLFYKAGLSRNTLQLAFGDGRTIGHKLVEDERFAGISFTGGTDTGKMIATTQIQRNGPIGKLVAETGGINAMIVDSTALPEQVVKDSLYSAFNSAGQRCSALRILCVQEEIYDRVMTMLEGGLEQLFVGDPSDIRTDVGPIIDKEAMDNLRKKIRLEIEDNGNIFPPQVIEIDSVGEVTEEIFGPVLHVLKWKFDDLDNLIDELNASMSNLTLGIHSRIEERFNYIAKKAKAGNVYINRNQVGAVVESQPFGGFGYSGTGPKAGGPNYLKAFVVEKTVSNNTTAIGGNTSLVMLK